MEKLQPASFRGVPFLVEFETKTGGKKIVSHEFVNSDERFVEELGELPPSFTVDAIIHGEDAINERLNLERVLREPGLGELVHPVYGTLQVKSTTYSVTSRQTAIGEFRFSINFESSKENVTAAPAVESRFTVSKQAELARSAVNNVIPQQYSVPDTVSVYDAAKSKVESIYTTVRDSINTVVAPVEQNIAAFNSVVADGLDKVTSVIQDGSDLKTALEDLYLSAQNVVDLPNKLVSQWQDIIDFGFLEDDGPTNTVPRAAAENNRVLLNEHTRVTALVNLYEAYAYTAFSTDEELDKARTILNEAFLDDFSSDAGIVVQDPDVRDEVNKLRVITNEVFNQQEQTVWSIVQIEPGKTSMVLTTFRYYNSLDDVDTLRNLNPRVNAANFNEEITALSK